VAKHYFGNPDLVKLSRELAQRNHDVSVATSFRSVDKHKRINDIDIFEINSLVTIHRIGYKLGFPFARIYRIVNKQGVEIIHGLGDLSINTAFAAVVSKVAKVPFVYTIQGSGMTTESLMADILGGLYNRTVRRLIVKRAKRVILLSERLFSRARELGFEENKVVVVPSGIDHAYFDPERYDVKREAAVLREELNISDSIVIGYVGRLIPAKGLTYLISAMHQIQSEHSNIYLVIVGDGPERMNLERMTKSLKMKVTFTGWQAETLPYYALMDIFVLPSFFEGLPNVILEAMAMEKPIVATDTGGIPDLIVNGKNGFLVPTRNSASISLNVKKLIESDELRRNMGRLNRETVIKKFSWKEIISKIESVYTSMID